MAKKATKKRAKKPSRATKKPKPKAKSGEDEGVEWLDQVEGMTLNELSEFEVFLDLIADRLKSRAKKDNWPDDRLQAELGDAKGSIQDMVDNWGRELSEELGFKVESIQDAVERLSH